MTSAQGQQSLPAASLCLPWLQVEVTPIDANHCPGAAMLLFKIPAPGCAGAASGGKPDVQGAVRHSAAAGSGVALGTDAPCTTVLHTGDFRWHAGMARHPSLAGLRIDCLMLDTTYCQPRWRFPPQAEAVAAMVAEMRREAAADPGERGGTFCKSGIALLCFSL